MGRNKIESKPFWARCVENAIIITARNNMSDVVISAKGNTLGKFDKIGKGSKKFVIVL